ncbi:MAG: amidohydrolase family protein [Microcella sp.]|uniref:amidohydrolase family protein n=1 Tax=Microcella sp. TaxID=1913979 RepID=UPI0033147B63
MSADTLLRNATAITMDPDLGVIARADLLIRNGSIVEVGPAGTVGTVDVDEILDLDGRVILPGFVDTHLHLWNSMFRGIITGYGGRAYFPVKRRLAAHVRPEDTAASTALGLAECIGAGITSVVNWHHNLRSPDDADATIDAQVASGARTRLAYGNPDAWNASRPMDLIDVARLLRAPSRPRFDVGLAVRGPTRAEEHVVLEEWTFAQESGLPLTLHMGGRRADVDRYADIAQMDRRGLLIPQLQVVHAVDATPSELVLLGERGVSLSVSPVTEITSMGVPPVTQAMAAGMTVSLSNDSLALPGRADMFAQMQALVRLTQFADPGRAVSPQRALQLATIEGARDLGWESEVGSLSPGKRADMMILDARLPGMGPGVDPVHTVVMAGGVEHVQHVLVDGEWLKRDGRLVADTERVVEEARGAISAVMERAGWPLDDLEGLIGGVGMDE